MSKTRDARKQSQLTDTGTKDADVIAQSSDADLATPFKPQRALFAFMAALLVILLAVLLVLYFKTVYPSLHHPVN